MFKTFAVGPWTVRCDAAATRAVYAAISKRSPEECGCSGCRNWLAVAHRVHSPEFLALCGRLGIAPKKEAEVYECGPADSGHCFGAWWHFVGSVEAGPRWNGQICKESVLMPYGAVSLLIHEDDGLVPDTFGDQKTVQLEIFAELPWVLEEESDA